jgi:hypothetical protein
LHPATRLRRFSPLFSVFFAPAPSSSRHALQLLLEGISAQEAARPPSDKGPHAFGGPYHLKGFSPPHLEDYIIWLAYPHILWLTISSSV